jgi:hypothetical protein
MVLINVTDDTFVDIVSDNCNLYLHEKWAFGFCLTSVLQGISSEICKPSN